MLTVNVCMDVDASTGVTVTGPPTMILDARSRARYALATNFDVPNQDSGRMSRQALRLRTQYWCGVEDRCCRGIVDVGEGT